MLDSCGISYISYGRLSNGKQDTRITLLYKRSAGEYISYTTPIIYECLKLVGGYCVATFISHEIIWPKILAYQIAYSVTHSHKHCGAIILRYGKLKASDYILYIFMVDFRWMIFQFAQEQFGSCLVNEYSGRLVKLIVGVAFERRYIKIDMK